MQNVRTVIIIAFLGCFINLIFLSAFSVTAVAQKKTKGASEKKKSTSEPVVAKIASENLTLKDYERQFIRNNGGADAGSKSTFDERKDFLNLLVKYKLKVLEAKRKGYDKDPDVRKELVEYRQSLATPYLIERELIDPHIKQLFDRRQFDVRAAHILIRMIADSLGVVDTMATLAKANEVLQKLQSGIPFDTLAKQYSADTQSGSRGGDLGYFTAGMTLPAFDDIVYSMKSGEVYPTPVRTPFGYHVVRLIDKRNTPGRVRVSHILTRLPTDNPSDTAAAYAKISLILDTLKRGGNFVELAKRNSEDPGSAPNGGDLGFAERRKFVPQFEEAAFALKNIGDISGIVRSPFGYHIIKLNEIAPSRTFEEQRQELKELYQKYGYQQDNDAFIKSLKNKYQTEVQTGVINKILSQIDSSSTTSSVKWDSLLTKEVRAMTLIKLSVKDFTVQDMIDKLPLVSDLQGRQLNRAGLMSIANKYCENEALALETKDLEKRYPDFGQLMHEYEEGVLLFRAEQEAVWNKVSVTDAMLQKYWEDYKADYKFPDRLSFSEIFVTSDSLVKVMQDSLKAGKDFGDLASRQTQRSGYREKKGSWGFQTQDVNDLSKAAFKMNAGEVSDKMKFQYGYSLIKVDEKDAARIKTFKESASEVSSKVQELESKRIEREWIDSLKKQFKVMEYPDVLKDAFKDTSPAKSTK